MTRDPKHGTLPRADTIPIAPTEPPDDGHTDPNTSPPGGLVRGFDYQAGQMIGHFVVREWLGEGGMGVVLAGHDPDLGRPVAIKLVRSEMDRPAYRARLLREAQAMARLEHPNIARVYEIGNDNGRLFVAMELVDGVTLSAWLKVQRRPWREIIAMFEQIGAGLAAVHRAGLVHRDFKPDNVLVDRDGRARVVDFGIARRDPVSASQTMSPELAASLTRTGVMMGTPGYIAPEQQFGGDVDARADQYSYCVALREALLGTRVVSAEDDIRWQGVPRWLRAVVSRGLSYDPDERFASMDELLAMLERAHARRARGFVAAGVGIAVAASIVAAIVTQSGGRTEPSGDRTAASGDRTMVGDRVATATGSGSPTPAPIDGGDPVVAVRPSAPGDASIAVSLPSDASHVTPAPTDASRAPADASHIAKTLADARTADASTRVASDQDVPHDAAVPVDARVTLRPPVGFGDAGTAPPAPVRHAFDPAHRVAALTVFGGLGWRGVTFGADLADDERDATDKIAAATDLLDKGKLQWGLGMVQRKRGNCEGALVTWMASRKTLADFNQSHRTEQTMWSWFALDLFDAALCELQLGRIDDTIKDLDSALRTSWAMTEVVHGELLVALGIVEYETLDPVRGKSTIINGARRGDATLRNAVEAWAFAVGMALP